MSVDLDDAMARSRPGSPFSNGTEGYAWMANWCDRCLVDAPFRSGISPTGCPLLVVAYSERTPAEWFEQPWGQVKGRPEGETAPSLGDTYHCAEFRAPGGGSGEPRPRPEPSDMDGLFERPERRTRMRVQPRHVDEHPQSRPVQTVHVLGGVL